MLDLPKLLLLPSLLLLTPNRSSDDSSLSDAACSRLGLSLMLVFPATPAGRGGGRRSNPLPPADRPLRAPPLPLADHPLRAPPAVSGGLPGPRRLAGMGGMLCDFHGSCEGAAILQIYYFCTIVLGLFQNNVTDISTQIIMWIPPSSSWRKASRFLEELA